MFHLLFLVLLVILYKKYLWYISSDDVFENKKMTRRVGSSARLGSAGAFRPDRYMVKYPTIASSIRSQCLLFTLKYREISSACVSDRGNFLTEV